MEHPELDHLQLYVDQRLSDAGRLTLDLHLAGCISCTQRVLELRRLLTGLASMQDLALPATFAADVAEEAAPSEQLSVEPARRRLLLQAAICLIILLTCGALLLIVDTPVTDPSDDALGAVDLLLGSPFQEHASTVAVLVIMALAGIAVIACLLAWMPPIRPQRHVSVTSHRPRDRRR